MASITVMFTDAQYGVLNYSYKIDEADLHRLYVSSAIADGAHLELLERNKGIIGPEVIREITTDIADAFIRNIVTIIQTNEHNNIVKAAHSQLKDVKITFQGDQ